MYLYDMTVNGINVEIKASNMATAVRRAVDMAKKRNARRIWIEGSRLLELANSPTTSETGSNEDHHLSPG